jgi:hypothetical protein
VEEDSACCTALHILEVGEVQYVSSTETRLGFPTVLLTSCSDHGHITWATKLSCNADHPLLS